MSMKSAKALTLAGMLTLPILNPTGVPAHAGNVGVDLNIHLGDRPQVIVPQAVPVPVPVPPPPAPLVINEDVNFIYPDSLGFYVAVGVPYDLFYVRNSYYLFRDGRWFRGEHSRGPWAVVGRRDLPPGLRRHKIERIRAYRDAEYDLYRRDRDHYRGRQLHASHDDWKEERRGERERWREGREERGEHRDHRGGRHD